MIDQMVKTATQIVELVGIAIILVGFFISLIRWPIFYIKNLEGKDFYIYTQEIRAQLGLYLMLGLEFIVASDIISTAIEPTQESLILTGSLVVIRIAIGYFFIQGNKGFKKIDLILWSFK